MASTTIDQFRIGSVIGRGVSIYFGNIIAFAIVTVILFIVPLLLTVFVFSAMGQGLGSVLSILLWMVAYFWLSAALVYGVVSDLRGSKAGVGDILSGALSVLIPVLLVSIVVGILVVIGTMALIIPGIILYVMFWVAVPSAVVERTGVGASMKRSMELTKGNRWKVFFIMLIWVLITMVIQAAVGFAVGVPMGTADPMVAGAGAGAGIWITQVVNMFLGGISASILAVGYHDLRVVKDGIGSAEIARAFD